MIEEIVLQHLAGQLEVPVGMEVPENPADTFCVLEKTGNKAELIVKPGTPAAMPVLPPLQRNDSYDEIYLAGISLAAGQVAVSAADITDLRLNEDYCGLMRDGVTGIPTAQLSAQADALMAQLREAIQAASSGEGVSVYTHQKSGTIHKLTGSGHNGRVKLTANVAAGDTVQVNGKTVPAYVGGEAFADALAGESLRGRWLSFVWDGTQVNFKAGGGLSNSKLALATADTGDVISGKKFYSGDKSLKTGSILPRNTVGQNGTVGISQYFSEVAVSKANSNNTQTNNNLDGVSRLCLQPPAGFYDGNSYVGETFAKVASAIGLTAGKLCVGNTVLGVKGTGVTKALWNGSIPEDYSTHMMATTPAAGTLLFFFVGDAKYDMQIKSITIGSNVVATPMRNNFYVATFSVSANQNIYMQWVGNYGGGTPHGYGVICYV